MNERPILFQLKDPLAFWRGCCVAVPISLALWAVIILIAVNVIQIILVVMK